MTDDLDVGAFYSENPNANYDWLGLEAKYAILRQREDMPIALAVRGAYTKTLYVADMDMHALGADVSVGRTFRNVLTPYLWGPEPRASARPEAQGVGELVGRASVAPRTAHSLGEDALDPLAARAPGSGPPSRWTARRSWGK